MSLYDLAEFRRLRDEHGLALYAESIASHQAKLAVLEDPEQIRAQFVAQWEAIYNNTSLDDLTRQIALKQLKEKARDALSVQRALIAHEKSEIERIRGLYESLAEELLSEKEIA